MVTTWCRREAGERRTISDTHRSEPPPPNPSIRCSTRTECAALIGAISPHRSRLQAVQPTSRLFLSHKVESIGSYSQVRIPANREVEILHRPHHNAKEGLYQSLKAMTGNEIAEVLCEKRCEK